VERKYSAFEDEVKKIRSEFPVLAFRTMNAQCRLVLPAFQFEVLKPTGDSGSNPERASLR
jgi:hypothetical protein